MAGMNYNVVTGKRRQRTTPLELRDSGHAAPEQDGVENESQT